MNEKEQKDLLPYLTGLLLLVMALWIILYPLRAYISGRAKAVKVLNQALSVIESRHIRYHPPEKLIRFAISGLLVGLNDPYADYLDPESYRRLTSLQQSTIGGIGVHLIKENENFVITSVIPGSPAESAGVLKGDILLEVDGEELESLPFERVSSLVKGKPGTKVRLTIQRGTQTLSFEITRKAIRISPLSFKILEDGIAYLKVDHFPSGTASETKELLKTKRFDSLIIDLRDNPGGFLDEAVKFVDLFASDGLIVKAVYRNQKPDTYYAEKEEDDILCPLTILINHETGSAGEIVASALNALRHAPLIGSRTLGKGTTTETYKLADGSAITISTAYYVTSSGDSIEGKGIQPTRSCEPDRALELALSILKGQSDDKGNNIRP